MGEVIAIIITATTTTTVGPAAAGVEEAAGETSAAAAVTLLQIIDDECFRGERGEDDVLVKIPTVSIGLGGRRTREEEGFLIFRRGVRRGETWERGVYIVSLSPHQ